MRCRFCGTPLPDDARFCSGCGREVERRMNSAQEKNSNEPEDAYYRELNDEEYDEIKKQEKEAERLREEAAKEKAAREKYAREEAGRRLREEKRIKKEEMERKLQEEKRAKEEAEQKLQEEKRAKEEVERRLQEEKRAKEEAERKRREEQRIMEESRRKYEEEQRRWKESLKAEEEKDQTKQYRGYDIPTRTTKQSSSKVTKEEKQQTQKGQEKAQGKVREKVQKQSQTQLTQQLKSQKKKKPMSVFAYFLIIIVGGFALYKCGFPEMVIHSISKNSSVSNKEDTSKGSKNSKDRKKADKATEGKDKKEKTEATSEEEKRSLADTDNSSMNVDSCLNTDAYDTVIAEDGSFSFGYPKYLFNQSEVNKEGTSYTLSYKEGNSSKTAELTVYTESNKGNALENAKQLYQRFSSQVNKMYFKMQPTRIDSSGMARALIGASVDSSETMGVYIIAANDGEKNYILKFTYPDPDMKDDYNEIDYVVDCVYRYCSFSGGTYRPRTYQQFLKDDMGTKK